MNNMTIRLRMLACITAAAATSLAFLAPCVSAAQPKSTIYGTPAQLVADFASAGYDLRKMVYNRRGQTPCVWKRGRDSSGVKLNHGSTTLIYDPYSGVLRTIYIASPKSSDFTVGEPIGRLRDYFMLNVDQITQRCGSDYAAIHVYAKGYAKHEETIVSFQLLLGEQNALWTVIFDYYTRGGLKSIRCVLRGPGLRRTEVSEVDTMTPGGRMYSDLQTAGLAFLQPLGHREVASGAAKGELDDHYPGAHKYHINNGTISLLDGSNCVVGFRLGYMDPDSEYIKDMKARGFVMDREPAYPLDEFADLLESRALSRDESYGYPHFDRFFMRSYILLVEQDDKVYSSYLHYRVEKAKDRSNDMLVLEGNVSSVPAYPIDGTR